MMSSSFTYNNGVTWNILMNDCSCTNNDVVTDRDSLKNHNIGTNPTIFSDRYSFPLIKGDFFLRDSYEY